jgi:hypothetical protein
MDLKLDVEASKNTGKSANIKEEEKLFVGGKAI